jgi:hypothetical protein
MNLRRGLFRLWIVGSALFVLAVAFLNYSDIEEEFEDAASVILLPVPDPEVIKRFQEGSLKPVTDPALIKRFQALGKRGKSGSHRLRHSASGASSWFISIVGFVWVRCYTALSMEPAHLARLCPWPLHKRLLPVQRFQPPYRTLLT